MLAYELSTLDNVPADIQNFYEEANGSYRLKVSGVVPEAHFNDLQTKLNEFRENNRNLYKDSQKLKSLTTVMGDGTDLDPDKLQARINSLAEARVGEMKTSYETQLAELSAKYAAASTTLSTHLLSSEVTKEALKAGVTEFAVTDVIARAQATFEVVDGKLQAKNGLKNKKGDPLALQDWVTSLAESAPHFFSQSSGAGATRPTSATSSPALSTHEKLAAGLAKLRR